MSTLHRNGNLQGFYSSSNQNHLANSSLHPENKLSSEHHNHRGHSASKLLSNNMNDLANSNSNNSNNSHSYFQAANNGEVVTNGHQEAAVDDTPTIDIIINNVVCTFNTKCFINLKKVATEGAHVEYKRENGVLNMKLRDPYVTASVWSSGKITCTGATSEEASKVGARRVARRLQRLGFNVRFTQFRVVNVLGTCSFPFGIRLNQFSKEHKANASYEPEIHPGVTYRLKEPKATLKVFSTGSITVTAPCVLNVQLAIEHIYPLVEPFKMPSSKVDKRVQIAEHKYLKKGGIYIPATTSQFHPSVVNNEEEDEFGDLDDSDFSDFDSDFSQD